MKPRIHLIGGPGSGKSYATARLSSQLDIPAYDLDDLPWDRKTYDVRTEPAVRDQQLASLVQRDGWIIEGVYYGWVAPSLAAADMIIAMTPSIAVRHWRAIKRFVFRKTGRVPSRNESLASLWGLLRWSPTCKVHHLPAARRTVMALGRTWVECQSLEDIPLATCYLERHYPRRKAPEEMNSRSAPSDRMQPTRQPVIKFAHANWPLAWSAADAGC